MRLRTILTLVALVAFLAVPAAAADQGSSASAKGAVTWTIPPETFGVEIHNILAFTAKARPDGTADGRFLYIQTAEGESFVFGVDVTCMKTYDGNRAKIGGVITYSNDVTQPVGKYAWLQVFDLGKWPGGQADRSSLIGFGDEAANEAFCNSPNLPRFGPWDVFGDIKVKT